MMFTCLKRANTKIQIHKYANTQIQQMTKCHKDPTCGIFLKRGFFRGIKYNILMCQMNKYIDIVYILPTIGEIFVFCWVYIDIIHISCQQLDIGCIIPTLGLWKTHQKMAKIQIIHCKGYNIEYWNLQNIFIATRT